MTNDNYKHTRLSWSWASEPPFDPYDDCRHWTITYRLDGVVVEIQNFTGDYMDAEREAENICVFHHRETRPNNEKLLFSGEKLDFAIVPQEGELYQNQGKSD